MAVTILQGDAIERLRELPADSVHCVVTSPPYWNLRDYGTGMWEGGDPECDHRQPVSFSKSTLGASTGGRSEETHARSISAQASPFRHLCGKCGARRIDQQIGLEPTPESWAARLVEVFREVRRVLRPDGVCWINVGDSYNNFRTQMGPGQALHGRDELRGKPDPLSRKRGVKTLKEKDLVGQPWLLAFALRADGWWLRSEIIWCLSGGTRVYARTQKGEMPTTIKDLVRLDPATVQLWSGEKWAQVLGWSETPRPDQTYEIELRSGQRIGCTAGHLWPTQRGNVRADEIQIGDVIATCRLPEPEHPRSPVMLPDLETGWLAGLYLAEGSRDKDGKVIQIASHAEEVARFERLRTIAKAYDGTFAVHLTGGFSATANIHSPTLAGVVDTYIAGSGAAEKHLTARCWRRSNIFLRALLEGYLEADGHFDEKNNRWRLGFTANDAWAEDLRAICARLGICLRLRRCDHTFAGRTYPGWRGEIRFDRSGHHNCRDDGEVVAIRESRARKFWDIGVADEPHLFALASGVLTHNSKPNPMPESVRDRCTKSHEQVFLLTKSATYYYDQEAVREAFADERCGAPGGRKLAERNVGGRTDGFTRPAQDWIAPEGRAGRNARSVWTIPAEPFSESHFAVFPRELVRRCILAGTSAKGCCPECGAPWARLVEVGELTVNGTDYKPDDCASLSTTTGWRPTCACPAADPIPCTVLDCFGGSGTTGVVADALGRDAILIELNADYAKMADLRVANARARRMLGNVERIKSLPGQMELAFIGNGGGR